MSTIASYPVLDFSGGVRRDIGQAQMQKNELLDARNVHVNEKGRIRTRLGSQQLGQTLTGTIENSFFFKQYVVGFGVYGALLVNNTAQTSVVSILYGTTLTSDAAVGDTSLTVASTTSLAASGTVEIEGDLISYTTVASGTSLTGVTGITTAHSSGAPVHQWITLTQPTPCDARFGITYAVLGGTCYFGSGIQVLNALSFPAGVPTVSLATTAVDVTNLTNYHDRLYAVGTGASSPSGVHDKVYFSARGNGASWTPTVDYFSVETQDGGALTGLKVVEDNLGIFKANRIFVYDEIQLRSTLSGVGAFNQKVIKIIDDKCFTFCANGIFVTNLFSAKSIGEPVSEYIKGFLPTFDTLLGNRSNNTHAWVYNKSYFLYINDITVPTATNDVVLEYNTVTKAWTVHDGGYTNFFHVNTFSEVAFGRSPLTVRPYVTNKEILIAGDSGGKVWRLHDNKFLNSSQTIVGSDIYVDLRSNTGTPISSRFETQMYDLTHPELFKKFKRLRVFTESGQWNLEYRVEDEKGISSYKPLGTVSTTNKTLPFPGEAQGWSCGFRISSVSGNAERIFNGFVFEDTEVVPRP